MRISDWSSDVCSSDLSDSCGRRGDHVAVLAEAADRAVLLLEFIADGDPRGRTDRQGRSRIAGGRMAECGADLFPEDRLAWCASVAAGGSCAGGRAAPPDSRVDLQPSNCRLGTALTFPLAPPQDPKSGVQGKSVS